MALIRSCNKILIFFVLRCQAHCKEGYVKSKLRTRFRICWSKLRIQCYNYANQIAGAIPMISYWMKKDEYDPFAVCAVFNKCHYQVNPLVVALSDYSNKITIVLWIIQAWASPPCLNGRCFSDGRNVGRIRHCRFYRTIWLEQRLVNKLRWKWFPRKY